MCKNQQKIKNFFIFILTFHKFLIIIKLITVILDLRGGYLRVYQKVRNYIDEKGIKQVAVAQKAGISTATFNAIMNGKRTLYADDLREICIALDVSPEMFIEIKSAS